MSASTTPAFSFSKRFLEPVSKCLEVPPELVKLAQRRVEEQGDIRHGALGEVSWRALRRVLAVKQRDAESVKEQEQAYLSDESVNVFMKMVCVKMNSEHYSEAVTESASIDLTDHHIRYITLHSAAWTSLYNRLLGANKIDEAEYRKQAWRMLQRQGINSEKFDDVRLLDAIFLPWCNRAHWTLGIIFPSKRRFALLNSLSTGEKTADAEKRRRMFVTFVKRHLELLTQGSVDFEAEGWKETAYPESGEQTNGSDCGAFVCLNAVAVARGKGPYMVLVNKMPGVRLGIAAALVHGSFTDGMLEL